MQITVRELLRKLKECDRDFLVKNTKTGIKLIDYLPNSDASIPINLTKEKLRPKTLHKWYIK